VITPSSPNLPQKKGDQGIGGMVEIDEAIFVARDGNWITSNSTIPWIS
jgi:hypothetical protein